MTFSVRQVTVGTAGSVLLTTLPPGPCGVTVSNLSNATLYLGPGTAVSSTTGFPVPASVPSFAMNFPSMAAPSTLYGIASAGTANTIGVIVTGTQ
jgi:hypothetical protein